jgi:uncharacterized protein YbjQ (UPF0145 family)
MFKKILVISTLLCAFTVQARNDVMPYDVNAILASPEAKANLLNIPLYFGSNETPVVTETFAEVSTNKKNNAFLKSDEEACQWVILTALKTLQQRAQKEGMDAVVNIYSVYQDKEFRNDTALECGAGAVMAGTTLKGTLVKF